MKLWKKSQFFYVSYVQDSTWTLFSKRIYASSNHNYIYAFLNCSMASTSYGSISIFNTFTQPYTMTCSSRRWSTKTHSFKFSMIFSFQDRNLNSLGIKNVIFIKMLFIFQPNNDAVLGFICLSIHQNTMNYCYKKI